MFKTLEDLVNIIRDRKSSQDASSYTTKLLKDKSVEHIMNTTGLCTKCKSCRETVRRIVLENAVESCSMRL